MRDGMTKIDLIAKNYILNRDFQKLKKEKEEIELLLEQSEKENIELRKFKTTVISLLNKKG